MTISAWTFALLSSIAGETLGLAMICPEARYVTIAWKGGRFERRHAGPALWRSIEADLLTGFPGGVVPKVSAVTSVLAGSRAAVIDVGQLHALPVTIGEPSDAVTALDGALRRQLPA